MKKFRVITDMVFAVPDELIEDFISDFKQTADESIEQPMDEWDYGLGGKGDVSAVEVHLKMEEYNGDTRYSVKKEKLPEERTFNVHNNLARS